MQLYGILLQYTVDFAFDWTWLRPFRRRMQEWLWQVPVPVAKLPPQVKARLLLEDLGPTYVKLGQIISSQGRALPLEWEDELAKLQSDVRPFAYDDVRAIVERVARRAAGDAVPRRSARRRSRRRRSHRCTRRRRTTAAASP